MAEKVIRVAIDGDIWKRFRLEALKRDKAASEYLAELIDKEVTRARRAEDQRHARANRERNRT